MPFTCTVYSVTRKDYFCVCIILRERECVCVCVCVREMYKLMQFTPPVFCWQAITSCEHPAPDVTESCHHTTETFIIGHIFPREARTTDAHQGSHAYLKTTYDSSCRKHVRFLERLKSLTAVQLFLQYQMRWGAHGGVVVKALRYKPAGRGLDSWWCHWNFSVT